MLPATATLIGAGINAGGSLLGGLLGGSSGPSHPRPMSPVHAFWLSPGSKEWDKMIRNTGGEATGMQDMMGVIWETLGGNVEKGISQYFASLDSFEQQLNAMPEYQQEMYAPLYDMYKNVGEKYLKNQADFESYIPKYEETWSKLSDIGKKFEGLGDQYKKETMEPMVTKQQDVQNQLWKSIGNAPRIGFDGQTFNLPANKQMGQLQTSLGDETALREGLSKYTAMGLEGATNAAKGQNETMTGIQGLLSGAQEAIKGYGGAVDSQSGLVGSEVDLNLKLPTLLMQIAEAKKNLGVNYPLDVAVQSSGQLIGAGGVPVQQNTMDWSPMGTVLGDTVTKFLQSIAKKNNTANTAEYALAANS